jgi:hypothetical protein
MLQPRIVKVQPLPNSKIELTFENGEVGVFDVSPYISGSWYGRLSEPDYFRTVHIVDGGTGIEWKEGQDIAPHELYELSMKVPVKGQAAPPPSRATCGS